MLSDALRPLADPAEIVETASRVLGEQLNVNHAYCAEAEGGEWPAVNIINAYEQCVWPKAEGRHPTAPLGSWILDTFSAGQRLVVHDLAADPRFNPSQRPAHAALNIHASVTVSLVKEGKFLAILVVHSALAFTLQSL